MKPSIATATAGPRPTIVADAYAFIATSSAASGSANAPVSVTGNFFCASRFFNVTRGITKLMFFVASWILMVLQFPSLEKPIAALERATGATYRPTGAVAAAELAARRRAASR